MNGTNDGKSIPIILILCVDPGSELKCSCNSVHAEPGSLIEKKKNHE